MDFGTPANCMPLTCAKTNMEDILLADKKITSLEGVLI